MISYALELARGEFDQVMMELLVNEGFSWNVISEIWEGKVAPYTQSLDSGIEGENIAFAMKSEKRAQWAAVHKAPDGEEFVAWGRTEILARRLAALKGILAESDKRPADRHTADKYTAERYAADKGVTATIRPAAAEPAAGEEDDGDDAAPDPEHLRRVSAAGGGSARDAESWTVLF